ncbi:hypothetical protein JCM3774_002134 [Rhodotorula dairenensis]
MSSELEIEKAEATVQHLERVPFDAKPAMDTEPTRRLTVLGTEDQDPNTKQPIPFRSWLILALCVLGQMQNIFMLVAPAANAYSISGPLSATAGERIWIVQAIGVPAVATGPIMAKIADIYGRRWLILISYALFVIGAIVAMTAKTINGVLAGQVLSGVAAGSAGLINAIASEVMPGVYRTWAQSALNCAAGVSAVIALIGMAAACNTDPVDGWRWIFRIALVYAALLLVGFGAAYFPPPRTHSEGTLLQKLKTLDWIGYTLLLGGVTPLLMGFAWSSDPAYGWHNAHAYGAVAAGAALLVLCILWEWKGTSTGFLDHRLFQNGRNFSLCMFLIAVEGALFYLVNNIFAAEMNAVWGRPGDLRTTARITPFYLTGVFVCPITAWYTTKRKDVKWPTAFAFFCFALAFLGFALSGQNAGMATAFNTVGGIGCGMAIVLVVVMVQYSTPPLLIGIATALLISVRSLGGTVGYAIAEAIYSSKTNTQIPEAIVKATAPLGFNPQFLGPLIGFLMSGKGLEAVQGATPQILGAASAALKNTEADAYKIVWFAFLPGGVIAVICCALFENPQHRMNWTVDAPLNTAAPARDDASVEKV